MSAQTSIRALIADPHAMFRSALRKLLESDSQFCVVGEASNGVEAVQLTQQCNPDVLLIELDLPGCSGLEALRALQGRTSFTRPLLLVSSIRKDQMIEALQLGAYGLLMKTATTSLLFKGIRAVISGQYWLGRDYVSDLVGALRSHERHNRSPVDGFSVTRRELEIIGAIVTGCTNKDLAQQFHLSEVTIKHHLTKIYGKLGISNRLELALFAYEHKLVEEERP